MPLTLCISPHGRLFVEEDGEPAGSMVAVAAAERIGKAFAGGAAQGLLHLATVELQTSLTPSLAYAREFARGYLTRLCHTPGLDGSAEIPAIAPPAGVELAFTVLQAPPMKGLEYLNATVLTERWTELDGHVREEIRTWPGGVQNYLRDKNPLWRLVGRVTFHLAENKRDADHPFAFMATYASSLSAMARVQHLPLSRALQEYAGAKKHDALLALLTPIQRASEKSALAKSLVDSGDIYQALAWTPREAYDFLQDVPVLEESGIIVRVPNWWRANRPPRPVVSVRLGDRAKSKLDANAMLDFSVGVTLDGQRLTESEIQELLASTGGLVALKGQWVELDRDKLAQAIDHWKRAEREARGGMTFFESMRLLSGAKIDGETAADAPPEVKAWTGIEPGEWLEATLAELRDPAAGEDASPADLLAQLRPYQKAGVSWLRFMTKLGLGSCLADDMGLGKTIQVLALLLHIRRDRLASGAADMGGRGSSRAAAPQERRPPEQEGRAAGQPSLLVVPASLIANWKSEIARFSPSLEVFVAHPSDTDASELAKCEHNPMALSGRDLVITTYGMVSRLAWLRRIDWRLVILDEAQAIKNSGTRQTKTVKELKSGGRIVLTGTPVENRLSDLWSLFDFANPGLLGGAKAFGTFVKGLAERQDNPYGPLRTLVRPYILRRLKTDKSIIADLPDKTEVSAYCPLSKPQAALYEQSVRELEQKLKETDGIQRRGIVLAFLMRLKQICNHPSQWTGDGGYDPAQSGKFARLAEICEELAERQEKALVFTQFREITAPLAQHLEQVFRRPGLILHGGTPVGQRRELVADFQREEGPPFFVLSLKAGGTGLNLTAASHVIHFDRWWNPAVENQATDRVFRIGQTKNVLVHKFVCRGTIEERIDSMIAEKLGLSRDLLDGGAEKLLTEMDNKELLAFVSLDVHKALGA